MTKPFIFIGDIHGNLKIVEKVLGPAFEWANKVFVGDFLDSYEFDSNRCVLTLKTVLSAVKGREDVTALYGNHDLQYLMPQLRCSGFDSSTQFKVNTELRKDMEELMLNFMLIEHNKLEKPILVSHAGLSRNLFKSEPSEGDISQFLSTGDIYQIGIARGGWDSCGGIFWCDWYNEFEPIQALTQIVGHTGYRKDEDFGILRNQDNYCIDCLQHTDEVLLLDLEGNFSTINLSEY